MLIHGAALTEGSTQGQLALLQEPLSLWGGFDPHTGRIIDASHPQCGAMLAGRVLAMKCARGSSSSSSALVEAARLGTAPVAIILEQRDAILVIGALVACELYGVRIPVVTVLPSEWHVLIDGQMLRVSVDSQQVIIESIA